MPEIGTLLGWLAFLLLGIWRLYWHLTEKKAESEKPKEETEISFARSLTRFLTYLAFGIVGVQLLGIQLFSMLNKSPLWELIGFIVVLLGLGIAMVGRYNLGTNWATCYEYQVKRKHELVTHGVYNYIRHPIYTGLWLFFIGSELIVQSYLLYIYIFLIIAIDKQAKLEEQLLVKHFGNVYKAYMKRTKRFLPVIW